MRNISELLELLTEHEQKLCYDCTFIFDAAKALELVCKFHYKELTLEEYTSIKQAVAYSEIADNMELFKNACYKVSMYLDDEG